MTMRVLSVNVGLPREVKWRGKKVMTGIYKEPVEGRIRLSLLNLEGDRQADLTVHGGRDKAAYCYPIEHYTFWREQLPGRDLPAASFGENFTTEGLTESSVHVGDRLRIGSAQVVVTQPRQPCFKLGIKFQSDEMVARFLASGRSGFYVRVLQEGDVAAGDDITVIDRDPHAVAISEITRLHVTRRFTPEDSEIIRRALQVPALPDGWKSYFEERLENALDEHSSARA